MTDVLTPFSGEVLALASVPDPVFAQQIVGAGVAVSPPAATTVTAVAPIAGTIVKLHPHAFAMQGSEGTELLVHIGIDTVRLGGSGFELLVEEGATVAAGDEIVRFDTGVIAEAGYSAVCPVIVLGSAPDSVDQGAVGSKVDFGQVLFSA